MPVDPGLKMYIRVPSCTGPSSSLYLSTTVPGGSLARLRLAEAFVDLWPRLGAGLEFPLGVGIDTKLQVEVYSSGMGDSRIWAYVYIAFLSDGSIQRAKHRDAIPFTQVS